MKRGLLSFQISDDFFKPLDRGLICYRAQKGAIPLNLAIDLDAPHACRLPNRIAYDYCELGPSFCFNGASAEPKDGPSAGQN